MCVGTGWILTDGKGGAIVTGIFEVLIYFFLVQVVLLVLLVVDDNLKVLDNLPDLLIGGVERDGAEAYRPGRAEVWQDSACRQGLTYPAGFIVLGGHMVT